VTAPSIDELRASVEQYTQEAEYEHYLHFSGRKSSLEMATVVARHAEAFTAEAVRSVLESAQRSTDADERRRHFALAEAVAGVYLDRELAAPGDELATAEAHATVTVGGETVPFHTAAVMVQNELDRQRRAAIEEARMEVMARLNPLRERIFTRHHELIAELGFPGYVEFYATLKQIDLDALGRVVSGFLDRTRDLYLEHIAAWFEDQIGVSFRDAQRHDGAVLFRMADHDAWFDGNQMIGSLEQVLGGLGVTLAGQSDVHLDTEDRPGKNPRAFCAPVRAPEEVYLVIRPTGGYQDYRALYHEAGHAEHFASVDAVRPFEERQLGDNSVTEAYATVMEHLLLDPAFVAGLSGASLPEVSGFVRRAHIYYLYMVRRYAAKIVYELELHRGGPAELAAMPERYAAWLSRNLGFRHRPEPYLADVDPGFYAAQYLRSWMLEAQLRERWRSRHGERWWAAATAGAELRSLWSLGQALPAHLLAVALGMDALGIDALERRIRQALAAA